MYILFQLGFFAGIINDDIRLSRGDYLVAPSSCHSSLRQSRCLQAGLLLLHHGATEELCFGSALR